MSNSRKSSEIDPPLRLSIRDCGNVPSFKNTKSIYRRPDGTPFIATAKKKKQWMENVIDSIASQLWCAARIACGETSTVAQQRSWIASHAPRDDARQIIRSITTNTEDVAPGDEGAEIEILETK